MRKKIERFYNNHNSWFSNFTSAMCGTIIGIILTFGTTFYFQYLDNKELSRKINDYTLDNIGRNIEELEELIIYMGESDKTLDYVAGFYPNRWQDVPPDSVESCLRILHSVAYTILDTSPEKIFSTNIDVWKTSDNLNLISDIGDCFACLKYIEKSISEQNSMQEQLTRIHFYKTQDLGADKLNESLKILFDMEGFIYFTVYYNSNYKTIKCEFDKLKKLYINAQKYE